MTLLKTVIDTSAALCLKGKVGEALDTLYQAFDEALWAGKLEEVFEACFYAAETVTDISLLLGVMTIIIPEKERLRPPREALYLKIHKCLLEEVGSEDRLEDLIHGLWP